MILIRLKNLFFIFALPVLVHLFGTSYFTCNRTFIK